MKKNQDSDDTVSEHCVGMFWARLDFMAPTTPGENALKADVRAKQWARLVAKKPASPKKVTSLARATSHPRPGGQPRPEKQPTAPEEPANRAQANGVHWFRVHGPEGGQFAEKNGPFAEKCGTQAGQGDLRPGFWLSLVQK